MERPPYKGRHIDPAMLPPGWRRRYVLVMTWFYYRLVVHLNKQVAKCVMQDPLGMFGRGSKMKTGNAAEAAPLAGLKGKEAEKVAELRDSMAAKRRSYEEGRANKPTMPQVRSTAPEPADDALSQFFAANILQDRSGRYGKGRGRFVVCEDDVFSPVEDTEEATNGTDHGRQGASRFPPGGGEGSGAAEGRG